MSRFASSADRNWTSLDARSGAGEPAPTPPPRPLAAAPPRPPLRPPPCLARVPESGKCPAKRIEIHLTRVRGLGATQESRYLLALQHTILVLVSGFEDVERVHRAHAAPACARTAPASGLRLAVSDRLESPDHRREFDASVLVCIERAKAFHELRAHLASDTGDSIRFAVAGGECEALNTEECRGQSAHSHCGGKQSSPEPFARMPWSSSLKSRYGPWRMCHLQHHVT